MARMITVDPITRIEGHLRIDVEVDGGKVQNSWSSGQMWRGIEKILEGRDPRDAWLFTQRICGVCTTVHAIASVRAVENALQINPPLNAQLIRNLIIAAHARADIDEGKAPLLRQERHTLHLSIDPAGLVGVATPDIDQVLERAGIQLVDETGNREIAEIVLLSLE